MATFTIIARWQGGDTPAALRALFSAYLGDKPFFIDCRPYEVVSIEPQGGIAEPLDYVAKLTPWNEKEMRGAE